MSISRKQIEQWREQGAFITDTNIDGMRTLTPDNPHVYNWEDESDDVSRTNQHSSRVSIYDEERLGTDPKSCA
jgi:hypothetical protein